MSFRQRKKEKWENLDPRKKVGKVLNGMRITFLKNRNIKMIIKSLFLSFINISTKNMKENVSVLSRKPIVKGTLIVRIIFFLTFFAHSVRN